MPNTRRISARMTPGVEKLLGRSKMAEIVSVPALRTVLSGGDSLGMERSLETIAIIDPQASLCILDQKLAKKLKLRTIDIRTIANPTSSSIIEAPICHVNMQIFGDVEKRFLSFEYVPVAVAPLARGQLFIGRKGVLERVKIEMDFPKNKISLALSSLRIEKYPGLSDEFMNLEAIMEALRAGQNSSAVMMLALEMERFLDRTITEDEELRENFKNTSKRGLTRLTLAEKLYLMIRIKGIDGIVDQVNEFVALRNMAAHAIRLETDKIRRGKLLGLTERIVAAISNC